MAADLPAVGRAPPDIDHPGQPAPAAGALMGQALRMRFLVDGMNVVGSRPDGWWRDRRRAQTALVEKVAGWMASTGTADVLVVFDGEAPSDTASQGAVPSDTASQGAAPSEHGEVPAPPGGAPRASLHHASPQVRYAPGGRGAADDLVAALVAADDHPSTLTVVTSDQQLSRRVAVYGAAVQGAGKFRSQLP